MNLVLTVLEIVAPVFLLGAVGYAWIRLGFEYRIQFVTRLAMTVSLPALIFTSLMQAEVTPTALGAIVGASVAAYVAITVVMFGVVRLSGLESRTYLAPLVFGNTGNLGLPLALFAFGDEGLALAVVVLAVTMVYSFTVGIWMVSGTTSGRQLVSEPSVAATLLGLLFLWQGWETPVVITRTLELAGQIVIPLMLVTLGVAVARLSPGSFRRPLWLSCVKVVVCGAAAWIAGRAFGLDPTAFAVLLLQMATPVAVTAYLIAQKYGADSEAVAGLVVVSTLLSVVFLPVLLLFVI